MRNFFRSGGKLAWGLIGAVLLLMLASTALFARTALVRHERDVSRMVFNDNVQLLDEVRKSSGALDDSLAQVGGDSTTGTSIGPSRPMRVAITESTPASRLSASSKASPFGYVAGTVNRTPRYFLVWHRIDCAAER